MRRDYYVNEEKKVVVCVMHECYSDEYGQVCIKAVGKARCCDKDTFDVNVGKSIAANRAKVKLQKKKLQRLNEIKSIFEKDMVELDAAIQKVKLIKEKSELKLTKIAK